MISSDMCPSSNMKVLLAVYSRNKFLSTNLPIQKSILEMCATFLLKDILLLSSETISNKYPKLATTKQQIELSAMHC